MAIRPEPLQVRALAEEANVSQPTLVTTSMSEQLTAVIRDAITTQKLLPGERYSVEQIAAMLDLGVSRTPVREALVRLVDAGLVSFERNRGVRIHKPAVHDLEELFQLRLMVEVPAAYRGAQHIDEMLTYRLQGEIDAMDRAVKACRELVRTETADNTDADGRDEALNSIVRDFVEHDTAFHELVINAAGNKRLVRTVRGWREVITTLGGWRLAKSQSLETILKEHTDILHAIKNKDPKAAAQAMYQHIKETGDLLMKELQEELPDSGNFNSHWFEGIATPNLG